MATLRCFDFISLMLPPAGSNISTRLKDGLMCHLLRWGRIQPYDCLCSRLPLMAQKKDQVGSTVLSNGVLHLIVSVAWEFLRCHMPWRWLNVHLVQGMLSWKSHTNLRGSDAMPPHTRLEDGSCQERSSIAILWYAYLTPKKVHLIITV